MLEDRVKALERPEGDMWTYHNQALKNPEYQMEGMLDCLREEMMMNMPVFNTREPETEDHYYIHRRNFNINIDPKYTSSRLYRRVENLETQVVSLKKLFNKANASKRKTNEYNPF